MADPWAVVGQAPANPWTPVKQTPAPQSPYEPDAQFHARMDSVYGAGKWRDTSDYRTTAHNRAVGGVPGSSHTRGEPGAAGAHDIVVPGLNPAAAAQKLPKGYRGYPESTHLHVDEADPWAVTAQAPAPRADPWQVVAQKPAAKPAAPQGTDLWSDIKSATGRRLQESWDATNKDVQSGAMDPYGGRAAMDTFNILSSFFGGPAEAIGKRLPQAPAGARQSPGEAKTPEQIKLETQPYDPQAQARAFGDVASTFIPLPGAGGGGRAAVKATEQGAEALRAGAATILSPEHVSDMSRAAAALHRSILGKWGTTADKEAYLLSHHARALRKLTPEQTNDFIDYVERRSQGGPPPDAPPRPDVSTKVTGARAKVLGRIQDMAENTPLRKSADAIRAMADRYKARIQYVLGTEAEGGPHFVRDYYAHLWKQSPDEVEQIMAQGSKQGSGVNLRARSVPTYAEGLARGLKPRYENPIDAMTAYNENMARFLATHDIKNAMVEHNLASWHRPGQQPTGWVKLEGKLAERRPGLPKFGGGEPPPDGQLRLPSPGREIPVGEQDALPPPEGPPRGPGEAPQGAIEDQGGRVAGVSGDPRPAVRPGAPPGPEQVGAGSAPLQIEDAAAKAKRVESTPEAEPAREFQRDRPVDKELLYAHPDAARIYNNNISRGLNQGDMGPVYRGTRAVVNSVVQLKLGLSAFHAAVIGQEGIVGQIAQSIGELSRGKVLQAGKTLLTAPIAPLRLARQGSRMAKEILGVKPPSEFSTRLNDLYTRAGGRLSMDRIYSPRASGSFFNSLKRGTFKRDLLAAGKRVFGENPDGHWDRAKGAVDTAGNIIQSAAGPLFEDYIPAVKRGAWASRMASFLKEHPNATEAEMEKYGRQVLDSVDNRFGEMMHDNLFWKRSAFQIAQLVLLSPGWDIGTAREIGGGVANIPKSMKGLMTGKGVDEKTAYVAALVSFTALQNGAMTYMHTGELPTGMDFFAYRTSGTNADGTPERAMLPGYMKDILGIMFQGPQKELANKLNPGLKEAWELYNNQDYRGYPIDAALPGERGVSDYLIDENSPISLGPSSRAKIGSGLTTPERLMSIRPAPSYLQSPERRKEQQDKHDRRMHKMKLKADTRQAAQYEP